MSPHVPSPRPGLRLAAGRPGLAALAAMLACAAGGLAAGPAAQAASRPAGPVRAATTNPARLNAVSAVSATDAWAVGADSNNIANLGQPLVLRWNGTRWTKAATPDPGGSFGETYLDGVSAASATDAWAVGYYSTQSQPIFSSLILHWNGTSWTQVPSPNPGGGFGNTLVSGVTARSATDAWAVGYYNNSNGDSQSFTAHWNGTSWTQVASPSPGGPLGNTVLSGVAAVSATDAWATGYFNPNNGTNQPFLLHWDGTSWTQVTTPNPGGTTGSSELTGVTAVSAGNAWAVGYYRTATGTSDKSLIVHWNGTGWKKVTSPNPGGTTGNNDLFGVSAAAPADAWTVGAYGINSLAVRWDGTSWKKVTAPSPGGTTGATQMNGVGTLSATDAWAVGYYSVPGGFQSVILRWNGTGWKKVASPS